MSLAPEPDAGTLIDYPAWRRWVTAKPLLNEPVHRWFVFPHSFSGELVSALIGEWALGEDDLLADPFVGAGTTLVAGQQHRVPTVGFDLSPLAVLASRVKTRRTDQETIRACWRKIRRRVYPRRSLPRSVEYEEVIQEAFDERTLATLHAASSAIMEVASGPVERDFLELALLRVLPRFSRLVQKGGWLTRTPASAPPEALRQTLADQIWLMLSDVECAPPGDVQANIVQSDARRLPLRSGTLSAVVTSPPYANRHDYTRVFAIELLFALLNWEETRSLRYQSVQSHPEAHPERPSAAGYTPPATLPPLIALIASRITDPRAKQRIPQMLEGYFIDLHLCLSEIARVLKRGGQAAMVIGNVQYCGVQLEVDLCLSALAERVGLNTLEIRAARYRGNSAQQMREFGRMPARESVVILRRT